MSAEHAGTLLAAWEAAAAQPPLQRALTLLAAARPERSHDDWLHVPIGERDRQLLALRAALFGPRIDALADCPRCGEQLELDFDAGQITVPASAARSEVTVEAHGYRLRCRTPDSADLLAAAALPDDAARALLLERCVTQALKEGTAVAPSALPAALRTEVERALAGADPQAEIGIALACPACAHEWTIEFDVLAYLWSELDEWAGRLLRDVHELASAYGWSERDILGMSAARRGWYLDMLAATHAPAAPF